MASRGSFHRTVKPIRREPMTHADQIYNERHNPGVLKSWVDRIIDDPPGRYSEKEQGFVEHCNRVLEAGRMLSDPMIDWLEDIYARTR